MSTSRPQETSNSPRWTVLLVEDNPGVRRLTARALESRGYRVLSCARAREALRAFEQEPVDLLLTDVVLPGLDGMGLARRLREICPTLKILLISGHPQQDLPANLDLCPGTDFLGKPFRVHDLVRTVRRSLRGSG